MRDVEREVETKCCKCAPENVSPAEKPGEAFMVVEVPVVVVVTLVVVVEVP